MVLFNNMGKIDAETFGEAPEYLLKKIMKSSSTVYFVTDQYVVVSIKSFQRTCCVNQSGTIRVGIDRRDQLRPKQWSKYLRDVDNKEEIVAFLLRDWHSSRFFPLLTRKTLYVNYRSCFFKLTCNGEEVFVTKDLESKKEYKTHNFRERGIVYSVKKYGHLFDNHKLLIQHLI